MEFAFAFLAGMLLSLFISFLRNRRKAVQHQHSWQTFDVKKMSSFNSSYDRIWFPVLYKKCSCGEVEVEEKKKIPWTSEVETHFKSMIVPSFEQLQAELDRDAKGYWSPEVRKIAAG